MKIPNENDTFVRGLTGRAQIRVFDFSCKTPGIRHTKICSIKAERNTYLFGLTLVHFGPKRKLVRKEASGTRVPEACFWNLAYFARGVVKNEQPEKYAQLAFWQLPGVHFRGLRNLVSLWLEF